MSPSIRFADPLAARTAPRFVVVLEFDGDVLGDPDAVAQAQRPAVHERGLDAVQSGGLTGVHRGREVVLGQVLQHPLDDRRVKRAVGERDVMAVGDNRGTRAHRHVQRHYLNRGMARQLLHAGAQDLPAHHQHAR